MKEETIRVETHQIKEGTPFYDWTMQECALNTSLFNPIKIDIEKKHPTSVTDQGVDDDGFTHCLINLNTLSITA